MLQPAGPRRAKLGLLRTRCTVISNGERTVPTAQSRKQCARMTGDINDCMGHLKRNRSTKGSRSQSHSRKNAKARRFHSEIDSDFITAVADRTSR